MPEPLEPHTFVGETPLHGLARCVERCLDGRPQDTGYLVAFSGGPDSTALLLAAREVARRRPLRLLAAHFDHRLDDGSQGRAQRARALCDALSVDCVVESHTGSWPTGESPEAGARQLRYGFLERVRRDHHLDWILTAHHRDDQVETVLLRLAFGSGWEGLAGIRPSWGRVLRPLLEQPAAHLAAAVRDQSLWVNLDPANADPAQPRARLRHRTLPLLAQHDPTLPRRVAAVARATRRARRTVHRRLEQHLRPTRGEGEVILRRQNLEDLPPELQGPALAWLHRQAGAPYPATAAAGAELQRQLRRPGQRVGCDAGGGWSWRGSTGWLRLSREQEDPSPAFHYVAWDGIAPEGIASISIPLPETGLVMTLGFDEAGTPSKASEAQTEVAPNTDVSTASTASDGPDPQVRLTIPSDARIEIRSRRPGDRIHPQGHRSRSLKSLLQRAGMPSWWRSRWPLLVVNETLAWIPGVATSATCPSHHTISDGSTGRTLRAVLTRPRPQESTQHSLSNPSNPGPVRQSPPDNA